MSILEIAKPLPILLQIRRTSQTYVDKPTLSQAFRLLLRISDYICLYDNLVMLRDFTAFMCLHA